MSSSDSVSSEASSSDVSILANRKTAADMDALAAKRKEQAKQLTSSQFVYVLVLDSDIIGVFASKEAAVARASEVKPYILNTLFEGCSSIDNAIKSFTNIIDNRDNPPDDGILVQLGDENDDFDSSVSRITIKKTPVLALSEPALDPNKKRKSIVDLTQSNN
mmetsp:Transcript_18626/g.21516  ORF Transcript_18626/g.21516 Transcript_18626/m.21516 type:complete len:162 (-) Transcript_18626:478-963(-)